MSADPIKGRSDNAWRKNLGDMQGLLSRLADSIADSGDITTFDGDITAEAIVRRAAHLLSSADANVRAEERHAWDQYAATATYASVQLQAEHADKLLDERRKRFARKDGDR